MYWLHRVVFAVGVGLGWWVLSLLLPNLLAVASAVVAGLVVPLALHFIWTKPDMESGVYWVRWLLNSLFAAGMYTFLVALLGGLNVHHAGWVMLGWLLAALLQNWREHVSNSPGATDLLAHAA